MDIDSTILKCIDKDFKSVKQISDEMKLPYVRTSVRLKQLRKRREVIMMAKAEDVADGARGVKPMLYRKRHS
jgi:hypothetical protein